MIYASSSIVINSSPDILWSKMVKFFKESSQGEFIRNCTISNENDIGFDRRIILADNESFNEKVVFLKDSYKIIMQMEDHPLLIGDTIFQIITSSRSELNDRKSTLCGVVTWRMRPGIIEAPLMRDKQDMIEDIIQNISSI